MIMSTPSGARKARSPDPDGERLAPTTPSTSAGAEAAKALETERGIVPVLMIDGGELKLAAATFF